MYYGIIEHYSKQARVWDFYGGGVEVSQVFNLDVRRSF
jgi:hypothetical protein